MRRLITLIGFVFISIIFVCGQNNKLSRSVYVSASETNAKRISDRVGRTLRQYDLSGVRTANMKGGLRTIRGTRRQVTESTWKRAIVTVKAGERIETL